MKRLIALAVTLILLCVSAVAETRTVPYGEIFSPVSDAGRLTVRYLWLGDTLDKSDKPGDCMILTSPDGKVMLIDAGNSYCVQYVIDALNAMGITRIDYLINSHPHSDHLGGASTIIDLFDIGVVYSNSVAYPESHHYTRFLSAIERKRVEHIFLREGMTIDFGEYVKAYVYNPAEEIIYPNDALDDNTQFMNNQSITVKFVYGESSYLFAGDLYVTGERAVTNRWGDALDSDVVKANHHGASTSSSSNWRKTVSPKITVITHCQLHDLYVAQKYASMGEVYHTFFDGNVSVSTTGDGNYDVLIEKEYNPTRFAK